MSILPILATSSSSEYTDVDSSNALFYSRSRSSTPGCHPYVWLSCMRICVKKLRVMLCRNSWDDDSNMVNTAFWHLLLEVWRSYTYCDMSRKLELDC